MFICVRLCIFRIQFVHRNTTGYSGWLQKVSIQYSVVIRTTLTRLRTRMYAYVHIKLREEASTHVQTVRAIGFL